MKSIKKQDNQFSEIVQMIYEFCARGMRMMDRLVDVDLMGRSLEHPELQFSLLESGLAAVTLAHIGYAMGFGEETEEVLNKYYFHIYRLLYRDAADRARIKR